MGKGKTWYGLLALVCFVFILYTVANILFMDPQAREFLSHKIDLKRELQLPVWLNVMYVHVVFACMAMAAGIINFSNRIFKKSRKLHRMNGYVYLLSVLIVVLTSGYMSPYATGGKISSMGFNVLNIIWLIITITAFIQIKRKRIVQHRNWMIRSYAFCFTNMLIHVITSAFHQGFGLAYVSSYIIGVYSTIVLLLVIPDIIIRIFRKPKTSSISSIYN